MRALRAGAIGGVATVAAMYLIAPLTGVRPLPDLLEEPVLGLLPGPVFGFLIDTLQHWGKILEEAGLVVSMITALAFLGVGYGLASRWLSASTASLGAALVAWLSIVLVLLPLGGGGFLGLGAGPVIPLIWAVLLLFYAGVLQLASWTPSPAAVQDLGRRRMLRLVPFGIGALGAAYLGVRLVPGWFEAGVHPPEAGLTGPEPAVTPVRNFFVISKNFSDPVVDPRTWALTVAGLVDRPLRFTFEELKALPGRSQYSTLACISNDVGGPLIATGLFAGVPLNDLLAGSQVRASATTVEFRGRDNYVESLPLHEVESSPDILVAYALNGNPLPREHGFPARMLIPGHYGMKGPKWLDSIELRTGDVKGYWEGQGWDARAIVLTSSRIDVPRSGSQMRLRQAFVLSGIAFAGTRGISRVEVSTDGGGTWSDAEILPPLSKLTWSPWRLSWTPAREGEHALVVRAVDGTGELQSGQVRPSFPRGADGYHRVRVTVAR
jgi:DMSO/TMAO reductase YedYZ molybdopterin-dependent catalytic subunit